MGPQAAGPLHGVRVVEAASFVAVPSAGMTLHQLGAEVIRVDPPGGGSDAGRWPLATSGASLFWANLNKGKRSVTIDHRHPKGRELLLALATAPGEDAGVFIDNMVGGRRLTHEELAARRPDVIHVHVEGRRGGRPAVDYTVNAEVGVPLMTGPGDGRVPVNHVLPAWDLVTGMLTATCVSSALLARRRTGAGAKVDVALADVALAGVAEMGWLADAAQAGVARPALGNHMFGCFGVDFATADQRRVMVVALTHGQWTALRDVTGTQRVFSALEEALGADLDDEGDRFRFRETIASILRPWFAARDLASLRTLLDGAKVLWAPYQDMAEVVQGIPADPGSVAAEVDQPGVGPMLGAVAPWRWDDRRGSPSTAPLLSADTESVLSATLGLSSGEIGRLVAAGVVGG